MLTEGEIYFHFHLCYNHLERQVITMKEINKLELEGSAGLKITHISCDFDEIKKLSDFNENWEIDSECPDCKRKIIFTKNNVNKLLTCKCGKKLMLEIPEKLL